MSEEKYFSGIFRTLLNPEDVCTWFSGKEGQTRLGDIISDMLTGDDSWVSDNSALSKTMSNFIGAVHNHMGLGERDAAHILIAGFNRAYIDLKREFDAWLKSGPDLSEGYVKFNSMRRGLNVAEAVSYEIEEAIEELYQYEENDCRYKHVVFDLLEKPNLLHHIYSDYAPYVDRGLRESPREEGSDGFFDMRQLVIFSLENFFVREAKNVFGNRDSTPAIERFVDGVILLGGLGHDKAACDWVGACKEVYLTMKRENQKNERRRRRHFSSEERRLASSVLGRIFPACSGLDMG